MSTKQKAMDKISEYVAQFGFVEIASGAMWEVSCARFCGPHCALAVVHHCVCEVESPQVPDEREHFVEGDRHC